MLQPEQVRSLLADANLRKVAEKSDLHYATLYRFMRGGRKPSYSTIKALNDYLTRRQSAEVVHG